MRILFFADTHGDMEALRTIKTKSSDADMIVCAGDISQMEIQLPKIIEYIDTFNKPILMIHGNHEDDRGLRELCEQSENVIFLHKGVHHVNEYVFMGYGGDGFSTKDPDFTIVANAFFKKESKNKKMVLITHGPPYNTVIDNLNGDNRGNKSYREFIDDVKPHIAVSGHLHENSGKTHSIGRTLFLNPGKDGILVNLK